MKKTIVNKINKLYCKCFTLKQEFDVLRAEIQSEADEVERKYDEMYDKYEDEFDLSDSVQARYDKIRELNDEMQDLVSALDDVDIDSILESIEPFTCDLPSELKVKLKEQPNKPTKLVVVVEDKEYIKSTGQYFMTLSMHTDTNPYPIKHVVYWSESKQSWEHYKESDSLPWLGGGQLFRDYIAKKDEIFTQFYNASEKLKVTFSLPDK